MNASESHIGRFHASFSRQVTARPRVGARATSRRHRPWAGLDVTASR